MTELIPNVPRMRKELAWLEEQAALPPAQSQHDQSTWISSDFVADALENHQAISQVFEWDCGTKACLCGHMAIEDGAEITIREDPRWSHIMQVQIDGMDPEEYGAKVLGISQRDASELFDEYITVEEQRELMEEIAGEPL